MEAELVQREAIPFEAIPAAGVHGVGFKSLPGNLLRLGRGLSKSRRILRQFQPDVLFFTGGYVAAPMALAARLPGLKQRPRSLVYCPDIEPGWALQALLRMADHAALTVAESRAYLPARLPSTVTGYPLRQEVKRWERLAACRELGLELDLPVFLVMGGSKGARSINQALFAALPSLLESMQVVHITGQLTWPEAEQARQGLPLGLAPRYHAFPYLHAHMGAALAAAHLALSRAGASSLGEFPYFSLPAILVPYPHAWRYQRVNAEYLVQRGAAQMLLDGDLSARLLPVVQALMDNPSQRQVMAQAMQSLAQPQAAQNIAAVLRSLAADRN